MSPQLATHLCEREGRGGGGGGGRGTRRKEGGDW